MVLLCLEENQSPYQILLSEPGSSPGAFIAAAKTAILASLGLFLLLLV